MLAAFTYRDFRVQWFGACTSSIGTWMQITAQNWLVLSLTGSAFFLGLDAFLQQLPIMLLHADRRRARRPPRSAPDAARVAVRADGDGGRPRAARVLPTSSGSGTSCCCRSSPASRSRSAAPRTSRSFRRSSTRRICRTRSRSTRFSSTWRACSDRWSSAATLSAGATWGFSDQQSMAACFVLNALSFLVVIYTLMSLHVKHIPPAQPERHAGRAAWRASTTCAHHGALVALIVLAATTTFLGFAVLTFLPLFAQQRVPRGRRAPTATCSRSRAPARSSAR